MAALSLAGLLLVVRDGRWRRLAPPLVAGTFLFASLVPAFYSNRYSLALAPVYVAIAAAGISSPLYALRFVRPGFSLKPVLGVVAIAITIASGVPAQRRLLSREPVETVLAGRALARVATPGDKVASRKPHIGYYSGLPVIQFPRLATLPELARYARGRGVRFLFYTWYDARLRPEFVFLLDTTAAVPGLELVHATDRPPTALYRLGEGFGTNPPWLENDFEHRLHLARALIRVLPDSEAAPHHVFLGAEALLHHRPGEAIAHATAAIQGRRGDPLAWTLLGDAQRMAGSWSQAGFAYDHALALDPRLDQARIGLGWTLLELGSHSAAAEVWKPLIGTVEDPALVSAMARLYAGLGDSEALQKLSGQTRATTPQ